MKKDSRLDKLIKQILKFGVVGGIAFLIDAGTLMLLTTLTPIPLLVANTISFTVSLVFNYWASMKFVFEGKAQGKEKIGEFIIFLIISIIGLLINNVVLWLCAEVIYQRWSWLQSLINEDLAVLAGKIIATGIVMVYNFIARKIFLEKKDDDQNEIETTITSQEI